MHRTALAVASAAALFVVAANPTINLNPQNTGAAKNTKNVSAKSQTASKPSPPPDKTVTVNVGDTLTSIAAAAGTTYTRLFDANTQVTDPNVIYPGQVLTIPAADEQLADRPLPADATAQQPAEPLVSASATQASQTANTSSVAPVGSTDVWYRLAQCESGGNWAINTGNGFYGGLQFTLSSWHSVGGSGYPNEASASEQIARAQMLQARQGWGAWPACSARLGL